ncbi:sensor histidine kinase NtrY-like [Sphingomonas aestuarii]
MAEGGVIVVIVGVAIVTYLTIAGAVAADRLLSPALFAFFLVANLIPAVALLVLVGRRIARWRAVRSSIGGSKLHSRLVATFSLLASIPIVLTVIAASVMFQSGVQLWGSERARSAFESTIDLVREGQKVVAQRWTNEARTMVGDIQREYDAIPEGSEEFERFFLQQIFLRSFYQAVLFQIPDGQTVDPLYAYEQPDAQIFVERVNGRILSLLDRNDSTYIDFNRDILWVVTPVDRTQNLFLYVATPVNADFLTAQTGSAREVVRDYETLQSRSRSLQLTFALMLYGVALLIIALVIYIAMLVADRLVRPVDQLVDASQRVSEGDLTARVPTFDDPDELGRLGIAFNTMTDQLQQQTNALVSANSQIESRRALIEAVMEGVTAGVVSVGADRSIRLINSSALSMLRAGEGTALGKPLGDVAPELDHLLDSDSREAVVQLTTGGEARTLAVKIASDGAGRILTFDDITQQLLDQRRAAWSDVARRIAHEIKNPLTPIQLAAERLQRRYGKQIEADDGTFARLTETIVRQVGDLRRMVDEFSSFARMPKPVFREESVVDLARQSLFLHEVAHPAIRFTLDHGGIAPSLICDRRQIGQALTNIVKNAVEAVEARDYEPGKGEISVTLSEGDAHQVLVEIADNGVGLPLERDRIVEPYMTTRARGTGLGLAIVKKIVDEHFGTIAFADRAGGGTVVTLCFDAALLANMAGVDEDEGGAGEARPAMLTRNSNG